MKLASHYAILDSTTMNNVKSLVFAKKIIEEVVLQKINKNITKTIKTIIQDLKISVVICAPNSHFIIK